MEEELSRWPGSGFGSRADHLAEGSPRLPRADRAKVRLRRLGLVAIGVVLCGPIRGEASPGAGAMVGLGSTR